MAKRNKFEVKKFHTITSAEETQLYAYIDFPLSLRQQNALLTFARAMSTVKKFGGCEVGYYIGEGTSPDRISINTGYLVPAGRDNLAYNGVMEWLGSFITPLKIDGFYIAVWSPVAADWMRFRLLYEVLS